MPKGFRGFEEPENWLSFAEIERVVAAFGRLGVRRTLNCGEPLLRRNLPDLVAASYAIPSSKTFIVDQRYAIGKHAQALFDAGLVAFNVSLDSLTECATAHHGCDSF